MNHKDFLYYLLYQSLLDIREEAYTTKNKKIHWISNLLHNQPMRLKNSVSDEDFKAEFEYLKQATSHDGMGSWFENMIENHIQSEAFGKELKRRARESDNSESVD